jgi:CO dehydrogenase maturation factor
MVKIAVTGKGGVGKTTIAAGLARAYARRGKKVIALDMDPSPNLLSSLGCKADVDSIRPLMEMTRLIRERTGAPPEGYGLVFKLNPKVDDLLERFGVECRDGVRLLVLGAIRQGGGGCFCPANALARRIVDYLSGWTDILVMDMEAGVEHLGRGTTRTAEILLIVVEPSVKSLEAAKQIMKLAGDLGIEKIFAVTNKIKNRIEEETISTQLSKIGIPLIYVFPYAEAMIKADLEGVSIYDLEEGKPLMKKMEELSSIIDSKA